MRHAVSRWAVAGLAAASIVATASPAQAALSVRALWNMDSLPVMVDSAGDNDGTTQNLSLSGRGYLFNSKSDIATVPDDATLDPGSATIKVTARVKFSAVPASNGTYDIIRKGLSSTAGGEYKMEIARDSSGRAVAVCTFKGSKGVAVRATGSVNLAGSAYQTITCTKTATSVQLTAGGQTRTTSQAVGSIGNSSAVYVGGKGDGTDAFPGVIDFVKIEIG